MDDLPIEIQLVSDIHLELRSNSDTLTIDDLIDRPLTNSLDETLDGKKGETVLVLAGDIGNPFSESYSKFLEGCAQKYSHVILVAGNHEFYNGQPMNFVIQKIRRIVNELNSNNYNIHFLNVDSMIEKNMSVVINGVKFIGTTLWSDISKVKKTYKMDNGRYRSCATINDFSTINGMSRERYQQLHLLHRNRLKEEIENSIFEYNRIVVVTHHLPTYELISDEYINSDLNHYYASDCSELISLLNEVTFGDEGDNGKVIWMCGHSHDAKHISIENVDLYLNPVGYKGEKTGYTSQVITI